MAHSYFVCSLKIWPVLPFLIQGRANTRIIVEKSNYGGNKLSRGKSLPNFSISRSSANKNQGQDLFLSTTHGRVSYPRLIENPTFLDCWGYNWRATLDINFILCKLWSWSFRVFNIMSPPLERKSILPILSEFSQFEGQGTSWNEISCTRARIVSAQKKFA